MPDRHPKDGVWLGKGPEDGAASSDLCDASAENSPAKQSSVSLVERSDVQSSRWLPEGLNGHALSSWCRTVTPPFGTCHLRYPSSSLIVVYSGSEAAFVSWGLRVTDLRIGLSVTGALLVPRFVAHPFTACCNTRPFAR
jgi:hypothetical protein